LLAVCSRNLFRADVVTELIAARQFANVSIQVVCHVRLHRLSRRKLMLARPTDEDVDDSVGVVADDLVKLLWGRQIESKS
ncbi:MAG: hypothetical protein ABIQ16_03090, partial [Polyangiaceae bacterium]